MRVFLAAIVVLLSSAATAQVPAQPSGKISEKQQPATCAVSGQVVTAAEGAPLKSSRIALIQQDAGSHPQAFSATTDSEGRFEIRKIAAGRYSFFATHTGYISQQYQSRGLNGGAALTLVPGQEIDGALFRLVRGASLPGASSMKAANPWQRLQ
jgi:5-hydroxyisourate hydrolase-like protein (transthyretin family)